MCCEPAGRAYGKVSAYGLKGADGEVKFEVPLTKPIDMPVDFAFVIERGAITFVP